MKTLSLFFILFSFLTSAYSQCSAPEVISWHFSEANEFEIYIDAPANTTSYEITFIGNYADMGGPASEIVTFAGDAVSGINNFIFDPTEAVPELMPAENYFYEVNLRMECGVDEWSATHQFYVSPYSLLNDPGFNCGFPFTTITYLADGAGFAYSTEFLVPPGTEIQEINDLGVLIDIGHTYNGDLSIDLTSPSGTTVNLLSFPNSFGGLTGLSMYFTDNGGTADLPQGIVQPAQPLSAFIGETTHGLWTLTVTDNLGGDNGFVFGGCLNFDTSPCISSIAGKTFFDLDSDGVQNSEEPPLPQAPIWNAINETLFFTNSQGGYLKCFPDGPVSLSVTNTPDYYEALPASHDLTITPGENIENLNFAITPLGDFQDLSTEMHHVLPDRPGFPNTYYVNCTNEGTVCMDNILVELDLDTRLTIVQVNSDPSSFTDHTATITIPELCPMESYNFSVTHVLADTVAIGAILNSMATVTPVLGDETPDNNLYNHSSTVVGAYDPNDKAVSHSEIAPQFLSDGEKLEYKIRFQNTGNYYAERVVIADTLDTDLNLSTFELMSHSHSVVVTLDENVVYFTFDDIFLPDSTTDEQGSHGYVRYSISPYPTLSVDESIDNTAHIYFDFNEAIVTNTVSTVLNLALGVDKYMITPGVFPNPATGILNIIWEGNIRADFIGIYDLAGKQVKSYRIPDTELPLSIDISSLSIGTYILRMEGAEELRPVKVVKM